MPALGDTNNSSKDEGGLQCPVASPRSSQNEGRNSARGDMEPMTPQKRLQKSQTNNQSSNIFFEEELLAAADYILTEQRADSKHPIEPIGENAIKVRETVLQMMQAGRGGENRSVLLLGEHGSGKTVIVDWCIHQLKSTGKPVVVLRAEGNASGSDLDCLQKLAAQLSPHRAVQMRRDISFQEGVEWIKGLFRGCFLHSSSVVLVLEQFEYFCSRQRQTLLYNLFDVAQTAGVDVCIVATSCKMNVIDMLEVRIRSRFSMRQLLVTRPQSIDELICVLFENLRLHPVKDKDLSEAFLKKYENAMREALNQRQDEWQGHQALGRHPSWFLAQCRPLQALLCDHIESQGTGSSAKRRKLLQRHSSNESTVDKQWACIGDLREDDMVVLIAMNHIQRRRDSIVNLSTILYEIKIMLHQKNRGAYMARYDEDIYRRSFQRLVAVKLIEYRAIPHDLLHLPWNWPCYSVADKHVGRLCVDLDDVLGGMGKFSGLVNGFRKLPSVVQVWASQGAKTLQ